MSDDLQTLANKLDNLMRDVESDQREFDTLAEDFRRLRNYIDSDERPRITKRNYRNANRMALTLQSRLDQTAARISDRWEQARELEAAIWPDSQPGQQ